MADRNDDHEHEHDRGLGHDLEVLAKRTDRRMFLRLVAGASLTPLVGCAESDSTGSSGISDAGTLPTSCTVIPEETGGPYPADGTNGPNTLTATGIVRSDITSSFGSFTGAAAGVPAKVSIQLVNTNASCAPLAGYAVYLWHCDRDGNYSLYTAPNENYLRGVQETDANGIVSFTSIFPACYSGRWPHIHFEVYPSLASATTATGKVKTSQMALPQAQCEVVYATAGYEQSVKNLAQITLAKDNVFGNDLAVHQMASVTGDVATGFEITLVVGIAV